MYDDFTKIDPPLHLIAGETLCWRCKAPMPVVAIICANADVEDDGPAILCNM